MRRCDARCFPGLMYQPFQLAAFATWLLMNETTLRLGSLSFLLVAQLLGLGLALVRHIGLMTGHRLRVLASAELVALLLLIWLALAYLIVARHLLSIVPIGLIG